MSQVIRIPDELYEQLKNHAATFETPADVIQKLVIFREAAMATETLEPGSLPDQANQEWQTFKPEPKKRKPRPTVADWHEHIAIVLGHIPGETHIGDIPWTRNIHATLIEGRAAFGATSTTAGEAWLQVIKKYEPENYDNVVLGLEAVIVEGQAEGKSLKKFERMFERLVGRKVRR